MFFVFFSGFLVGQKKKRNCEENHYTKLTKFQLGLWPWRETSFVPELLLPLGINLKKNKKEQKNKKPSAAPWRPWLVLIIGLFLITFYPKIQQEMWSVHEGPGKNPAYSCGSEQNRCFLSNTFIYPFFLSTVIYRFKLQVHFRSYKMDNCFKIYELTKTCRVFFCPCCQHYSVYSLYKLKYKSLLPQTRA